MKKIFTTTPAPCFPAPAGDVSVNLTINKNTLKTMLIQGKAILPTFKLVLPALLILVFLGFTKQTIAQSWYDSNWGFRKSHVITGSSGAGTNYQIRIVAHKGAGTDNGPDVFMGSNVLDNFGDVRFTASDGTTLLDYWMETGSLISGSQATFWVEVAADLGSSQTIFVYYGNSSASTTSNGVNTFILFDDFTDTSLDGAKWTKQNGGTPSFNSGVMTISANAIDPGKIIATGGPQADNNAIVARFQVTGGVNNDERAGVGVRTTNSAAPQGYNYLFRNFSVGNLNTIQFLDDAVAWGNSTTFAWAKNTFYTMEAFHDGTTLRGRTNYGAWSSQKLWTTMTGDLAFNIGSFDATTAWDWAFIRKCIASEPAHSTWGLQDPPTSPVTYSSSGVFIVPNGVTSITVECWGAGAGGSDRSGAAGGGGGGAYTKGTLTGLTAGNSVAITVGVGGAAGAPVSAPGNVSRASFGANTITANGGLSVSNSRNGGAGGTASTIGGIITASYSGGNGGNARPSTMLGNNEGGGGGGGSATTTANGGVGGNATATGGTGGTGTGAGGRGADGDGNPDAVAGSAPGGGSGGRGEGTSTSKTGANGQVIISWIPCTPPSAPGVSSPVNYCLNATASPLTATGSNLLWYTTPTGGTGSSTAPTPSTATAGTTSYYVSQTVGGCEGPRAQIDVFVSSPSVSVSDQSNVSCYGGSDGTITILAGGGTAPYQFSVNNGTNYTAGVNPYTFTGLSANIEYKIKVKDSIGCESPAVP